MRIAALTLAVSLAAALCPAQARAQVRDRHLRWRTIRTEHFELHYPTVLAAVARRAAEGLERAHRRLVPLLESEPTGRTQVVLSDDSESANGLATALPYNSMRLFATAPSDMSNLGDYDDWLTTLITHEHVHVVHLSNISGLPAIVNKIFGRLLAPNQVQPRFIIEGWATYLESRETTGGRGRSTQFDMMLRMAFLEDRVLTLDQLTNTVDQWPRGTSYYLYGSRLMRYIAERHGDDALAGMAHTYGRTLVPYSMNRAIRRETGKTFVEHFADWKRVARTRYEAQRDAIEAAGRREGQRLTFHGETALYPSFLHDGRVMYTANDGHHDSQLRIISATPAPDARARRDATPPGVTLSAPSDFERFSRMSGQGGAVQAPDGSIFFNTVDAHRDIYSRYDIFQATPPADGGPDGFDGDEVDDVDDADAPTFTRRTNGMRAGLPDISPDGRRIVFSVNRYGTRHLEMVDVAELGMADPPSYRRLVTSEPFEQVYTPRFSPDGTRVAYSVWRAGGYRDVHIMDLDTREVTEVTRDRAMDLGPTWTRDGQRLLFSSDRSGVANIYSYHLRSRRLQQVTNVLGGAYMPSVSRDGTRMVYVGYTSYGFDLWIMPLPTAACDPRDAECRVHDDAWGPDAAPPPERETAAALGYAGLPSSRYQPIRTLYPRSFRLDLDPGPFSRELGIGLSGEDIVGWFNWRARFSVALQQDAYLGVDMSATYNRAATPVTLRFLRGVQPRGGLFIEGERRDWIERATGGDLAIRHAFPRPFHVEQVSLGYSFTWSDNIEAFGPPPDPNDPPPSLPERGATSQLRAGWSFSDVRGHVYDISASEGRNFGVGLRVADPVIGSQFRSMSASWFYRRFIEAPWMQHHVFAISYAGGISGGDLGRRALFNTGGFPRTSLEDMVLNQVVLGGQALRGYTPFSRRGTRFHLAQLEYRFPIGRIQRGPATLPVFLNRVFASVFIDAGDAYFGQFDPSRLRVGVGAELFLDFTVGYILPFTIRAGFAYGLMDDGGGPQFYFHLGRPF